MEEFWKTVKTFLTGWASLLAGIGGVAIIAYLIYLMIR
jgi:hypothetical protein